MSDQLQTTEAPADAPTEETPAHGVLLTGVAAELTASGRTISTDISVTPSGLTVAAEAPRLRQAVTNLLDNAVRHTPPGTSIALHARALSDEWQLDVIDAGPGIAVADRERIFLSGDRGSAPRGEGRGLGLAIAREIAEAHGGRVAARFEELRWQLPFWGRPRMVAVVGLVLGAAMWRKGPYGPRAASLAASYPAFVIRARSASRRLEKH